MAVCTSRFSKVDEYGFERSDEFDVELHGEYLRVLARRAKKWSDLMRSETALTKNGTLKRYVRKGIPGGHRKHVWMIISGANRLKEKSPDLYPKLLSSTFEKELFDNIKIDLPRTFPDNIFFNNRENYQHNLLNVLIAYAHNNRDVGYCQGLNYIAGLLLLATNDEETSFWLLKVLIDTILPNYYTKTMDGLAVDIDVFTELIRIKVPDVYHHIQNIGFPWGVICTKWFVCLYAEVLPAETVYRIWDCLFYEGTKIIFRVCLTLIIQNKNSILQCNDFSSLSTCFKSIVQNSSVADCHNFMQSIFKVPGRLSNALITKLRMQYTKKLLERK